MAGERVAQTLQRVNAREEKMAAGPENRQPRSLTLPALKFSAGLLMNPGAESFYSMPNCGPLIVSGLCGGAMNPYNGFSHFVTSY